MWGQALLVWLGLLVAAVVLGGLREALLRPRVGEQRAHQIGTVVACVVFAVVIVLWVRAARPGLGEAAGIAGLWIAMSLAFEFGFFHYVLNKPWDELLADYNLARGRLLLLLWLTVVVTPVAAAWLLA